MVAFAWLRRVQRTKNQRYRDGDSYLVYYISRCSCVALALFGPLPICPRTHSFGRVVDTNSAVKAARHLVYLDRATDMQSLHFLTSEQPASTSEQSSEPAGSDRRSRKNVRLTENEKRRSHLDLQ